MIIEQMGRWGSGILKGCYYVPYWRSMTWHRMYIVYMNSVPIDDDLLLSNREVHVALHSRALAHTIDVDLLVTSFGK